MAGTRSRRTWSRLSAASFGIAAVVVSMATAPAGGSPRSADQAKYQSANLTAVSVAPHSAVAWALGNHDPRGGGKAPYALRRTGNRWSPVSVQDPPGASLYAIAAGSAKAVWAVGGVSSGDANAPLIEHSTGGGFQVQKNRLGIGSLIAVSASSPSNVWAVGSTLGLATVSPIVGRWNGSKWSAIDASGATGVGCISVSATGPHNVWILGTKGSRYEALRWSGDAFTEATVPVPSHTTLNSIASTSPTDAWVVGWRTNALNNHSRTFTEHWDGEHWRVVAAPSAGYNSTALSVSAAGPRTYLAGVAGSQDAMAKTAYVERFVAGKWKRVSAASPGPSASLGAISMSSKSGAAVGAYEVQINHGTQQNQLPLAETLHGHAWKQAPAPR